MIVGKDVEAIIEHYQDEQRIEICEHLIKTFDDLVEFFKSGGSDETYRVYANRENELLKKYGKAFKPYTEKQIYKLFNVQNLLAEKDYYTSEEYNKLSEAEQTLTIAEVQEFRNSMHRLLHGTLYFLYLGREPQFDIKEKVQTLEKDEIDKDITEARQLLAIYFLLKAGFDIEHRGSNAISETTRFAHLMTGTKFTTLQKSSIYKKYQSIPNYNKEEYLIKDLRFIRPYFEALHIQKALNLIDKEIETSIKELPLARRKHYQ
jgi:hypothetical protein